MLFNYKLIGLVKQAAANKLNSLLSKKAAKPGLWANVHAKKERGAAPAKPGDKAYPDAKNWKKVTEESEKSSSLNQVPENLQELALRTAFYSLGGAGVGGIAGAIFPEEYEEKNKKGKKVVKTMGRLESALRAAQRGGLTLGAVGLGGGALRMALDKSAQVSRQNTEKQAAPAWQTSEGKSESGGLNDKGRASLKAQGHDIKRPQPEGGPRKDSFCARMKGMKAKLTSDETANDPDSRINKSLRKWKCGSAQEKWAALAALALASNAPTLGSVLQRPKDEKGNGIKFQFGTASNPSFLR